MRIAILHAGNSGFFPRYYKALFTAAESKGHHVALFSPNSGRNRRNKLPNQITWGSKFNWHIHYILYKLTGIQDIFSICATLSLIRKLKQFKADIIHFNIINDKIICIPLLIKFINQNNIPVVWTMHDCRAFTGMCPYFDEINCSLWKKGCKKCPQCDTYFNHTYLTWKIRNRWHTSIKNLTIVTPSEWLAELTKRSFFKEYNIITIYNGVDLYGFSDKIKMNMRCKHNISSDKHVILGCSINWEKRKGLDYFTKISTLLPKQYQIVLIGNINHEEKQRLTDMNIICTGKTKNFQELVAWYQTANVFCNPTMADNFPTTNIEALAAGTPVVTFKTGGSPEAIDKNTGIIVEQGNIDELCKAIIQIATHPEIYTKKKCIERSLLFSNDQYNLYIDLFENISSTNKRFES